MSGWNEQRVTDLRRLWAEGLSATQIATRIGGCTRNAVLGKVHRLELPARATTPRSRITYRKPRAAPRQPKQPRWQMRDCGLTFAPLPDNRAKLSAFGIAPEDAAIIRRSLVDLNASDCRWPIGDPQHDDFGFCGAPALSRRPYCQAHAARAYRSE